MKHPAIVFEIKSQNILCKIRCVVFCFFYMTANTCATLFANFDSTLGIFWDWFKPILIGKILFTPETPVTKRIVEEVWHASISLFCFRIISLYGFDNHKKHFVFVHFICWLAQFSKALLLVCWQFKSLLINVGLELMKYNTLRNLIYNNWPKPSHPFNSAAPRQNKVSDKICDFHFYK